jgi:chaperonin GroEL
LAHGFSESVVAELFNNWNHPATLVKVMPLITPEKGIMNWRTQFLYDMQAYTGASVFNPLDKPLIDADIEQICKNSRVKSFECGRFTSNVMADEDQSAIDIRVDELKSTKPESQLEELDIKLRIGKLTSGIAKLDIYGSSAIETREKRDRAEDAWMAIRGTIKHGACPGGGYVLLKLSGALLASVDRLTISDAGKVAINILGHALLRPVEVLYENYGWNQASIKKHLHEMLQNDTEVFDILKEQWVPKDQLLDSVPAVVEAIRNAISIASLLGTIGGLIAFERDTETDRAEEDYVRRFEASIGERKYD